MVFWLPLEMNGSQILFADTCGIFFFLKWNVWLMLKNWDTAHVDLNFQIFWKITGFGTTGSSSPGAGSEGRPSTWPEGGLFSSLWDHLPLLCHSLPPHAPSSNLPPLIMWGIQGAPTKHQALGKSLETGKHNTAPTLEELANQRVNWWITVLPVKCRTEGMNTAVHRDSALRSWLEVLWRSLSWMKMSDSGRWSVGMECRTFMWSPAHRCLLHRGTSQASNCLSLVRCQQEAALTDAGLSATLCPGPLIPSFCQNITEVSLCQEEPAWLMPIHLQFLQLRQHPHSGETGYLRVILLFELFVLEPLPFEDYRSAFQVSVYQVPTYLIWRLSVICIIFDSSNNPVEKEDKHK